VTIHLAYSNELKYMVDADFLSRLSPKGYLINSARGMFVDESALIDALRKGTIAGAALDVFAEEPLPSGSPLLATPNLMLTPHVAGAGRWAVLEDVRSVMVALHQPETAAART
jgi:phosphoglycerate dehydrogenase-like enzyme